PHQVLPETVYIFRNNRIVDEFAASLHLLGIIPAHGDLFLKRVPVGKSAIAAHIAVADGVEVANATVLMRLNIGWIGRGCGRRGLGEGGDNEEAENGENAPERPHDAHLTRRRCRHYSPERGFRFALRWFI